ncbi:hypothetical protein L6164_024056 [Bauhinia variegata]|uniref:Uncharacterized protein n=1 Tax=Bauhinia variegata TaxID=167791 RepID=A0ACB9LWP7_BAUVA|nr:hypothetical protein L6164_024056 [Bauhinia variegata]
MADIVKEPLLKIKKTSYEECPGCKLDKLKETQQGIPFKGLGFIWIIVVAITLPISSLFPFLYFMIRDFHIAEREEDIAFYAGFLGSSFMIGRALTSILWGVVADLYGRKPAIIIGTFSVLFTNALFGLSVNFWMAITTRFAIGCMNGLLSPVKAYACEVFRAEYHALGLATVSAGWGSGLIIGPALGGFLAQPADKYPNTFSEDSVFGRFPYFLPCLVVSLIGLPALILSLRLEESLHNHDKHIPPCDDSGEALETGSLESSTEGQVKEIKESGASTISLLRNWPLMSSIIMYCTFSLQDMAYQEIFALWVVSPRKYGGLSFTSEAVGEILTISGIGLLIFQMCLYPYVERILGTVLTTRISAILTIPLLQSYPFMTYLNGFTLLFLLNCASLIKNVLAEAIQTGTFILQNKAVEQKQRGAANGLALTAMSICKAVGPAVGGTIFSWAQKHQEAAFIPGDHIVFLFMNMVVVVGVLMTFKPFTPKY